MTEAVDPVTTEIANDFDLAGGRPRLEDDALLDHADAIAALDAKRKNTVAIELVALARRAAQTDNDAWDDALVQLCLLVAVALGDLAQAGAALAAGGLDAKRAQAVVGAATNSIPVGAGGRKEGSVSPMAALLANRGKNPKKPGGE